MNPRTKAAQTLGRASARSKSPEIKRALSLLANNTRRLKKKARAGAEEITTT